MRVERVVIIFSLFVFLISPLFSGSFTFRKYAGEFMEVGVAPRAQGLGGAYTAISGDITAAYYNPAGLFNLVKTQFSFMHTKQMIASVNYDFLAFGKRQGGNRVFALSLIRLGVDNIKDSRQARIGSPENWRLDWSKIKEFNSADYIFAVSLAQMWKKGIILGANLKLIRRDLADHSANGIGFDLGVQKNIMGNFTVGANFKNVTSTLIVWDTGEKELVKPALFLGGTYLLNITKFNSSFRPVVDLVIRGEGREESAQAHFGALSFDTAAGMEYVFHNRLFVRAGVDEISRLNAGVGIQIPHITIDYAFTNYNDELGNSHRIGLIVSL